MAGRTSSETKHSKPLSGLVRDLGALAIMFGLLLGAYFLPPDTSLHEVRTANRLSVCLPRLYPPLVTGDPANPGFDVDVLGEVASRLGVRLMLNYSSAMGRDFNPRNWRVTRAQCQILAGGVVLSQSVRSFLDTAPGPLSTGWTVLAPQTIDSLDGRRVAVFSGLTGLDRIGLSRYLRALGSEMHVAQSEEDLARQLREGTVDAAVTEALSGQQIAAHNDWVAHWLPEPFERYQLGYGFWRGDVTLLQAVEGILGDMERDGTMQALLDKYAMEPIEATLSEGIDAIEPDPVD
ncbi:substrate-binding periplasmic protein [Pelagibacterium lacus]|uniref:ABC transporter substrate-binding protein n=1 Tax=Pelagibacterium lacus TaxID=2282655 RepID=A0A369W7F8_9HYPH|nr:transporter substrate-binding domain-containing protein [Pelagibacterium lacus]RDE09919.1 ABC transporter substrate-binding protein [Pelagibacterium lacus]